MAIFRKGKRKRRRMIVFDSKFEGDPWLDRI
jgi:hypothetical protein